MGKGNSERVRERGSSAKKGAKKSAVKKANQRSDRVKLHHAA